MRATSIPLRSLCFALSIAVALCAAGASRALAGGLDTTWAAGGVRVARSAGAQHEPCLVPDGSGGALLIWSDTRRESGRVIAQRINSRGARAAGWPDSGVALGFAAPGAPLMLAGFAPSGALAAWLRDGAIQQAWIDLDGVPRPVPPANGVPAREWNAAASDSAREETLAAATCPDGAGGTYMSLPGEGGVRLLHFLGSGAPEPLWPANGISVGVGNGGRGRPGMVSDGEGGVLVFSLDARGGSFSQIVAQRILPDGTRDPGWPAEGMPVCSKRVAPAPGVADATWTRLSAEPDGAGGAFVCWSDQRTDAGDIYVQHVHANGGIPSGWVPDGMPACARPGKQTEPVLIADGAGGVWVAWKDAREPSVPRVFVQHLGADGLPVGGWPDDGIPVAQSRGEERSPRITSDGDHGAIVAWQDERGPFPAIDVTHVSADDAVAPGLTLVRADAQAEATRLEWQGAAARGRELIVERTRDEESWEEFARLTGDASGRAVCNDAHVKPGRRVGYRVRLPTDDGMILSGETWLEIPRKPGFALAPIAADSADAPLHVSFTLPAELPGRIELADAAGRVLESQDISALGPGVHVLQLSAAGKLPPGIYIARLQQSGRLAVRRAHRLGHTSRGRGLRIG